MRHVCLLALLLLGVTGTARAVNPDEMLKDPALEMRAEQVGRELRCLVCQGESIEESNADLAHDLRRIVRERISAGDSDRQAMDFLRARYGDFVLLNPPFKPSTWILWLTPPVILALGGVLAFAVLRRRKIVDTAPLSDAERQAVEALR
jgi:cytochrome c-type biogenesis protein CcmH